MPSKRAVQVLHQTASLKYGVRAVTRCSFSTKPPTKRLNTVYKLAPKTPPNQECLMNQLYKVGKATTNFI